MAKEPFSRIFPPPRLPSVFFRTAWFSHRLRLSIPTCRKAAASLPLPCPAGGMDPPLPAHQPGSSLLHLCQARRCAVRSLSSTSLAHLPSKPLPTVLSGHGHFLPGPDGSSRLFLGSSSHTAILKEAEHLGQSQAVLSPHHPSDGRHLGSWQNKRGRGVKRSLLHAY